MKRFFRKIVFCLSVSAFAGGTLWAAEEPARASYRDTEAYKTVYKFADSYEPGSEAYETLRQANAQGRSKLWQAERLRRGESLPTGAARQLALELMEDSAVEPQLKLRLQELFPPETKVVEDHRKRNEATLKRLEPQIAAMERRLDAITERLHSNVYSTTGFPAAMFGYQSRLTTGSTSGLITRQSDFTYDVIVRLQLEGQIPEGSFSISLGGEIDKRQVDLGNGSIIRSVGISGTNVSWRNLQLSYGEAATPTLSTLLYSAYASSASSPFHTGYALSLVSIGYGPGASGNQSEMWNVNYHFTPRWWLPFTRVQSIYCPRYVWYGYGGAIYDWATRLDLATLSAGFITEIKPYITGLYSYTDRIQNYATTGPTYLLNNHAVAVGLDSAWSNGSSLLAEFAASDWSRNDIGGELVDTAVYGLFALPISYFTITAEGSQVGPRFLTDSNASGGYFGRLSSNSTSGAYLNTRTNDDERRPGKKAFTYQSVIREPDQMTNNSRRGALKLEAKTGFASLGLSLVHSGQIEPSGPWMQSHFVVNGLGYNGHGVFDRFYAGYGAGGSQPVQDFAKPNTAKATYNGVSMGNSIKWNQIEQLNYNETQTWILLNQNGAGDAATRNDSIKYLESAKAVIGLDLKPLFNRDLPFDLLVDGELRNLVENPGMPSPGVDGKLFVQTISNLNLRYGLNPILDLVGTLGYEDWETRQTRFPVSWYVKYGGLGFDVNLGTLMRKPRNTMYLNFRADRYEFWDPNFPSRNHSAWGANLGLGIQDIW